MGLAVGKERGKGMQEGEGVRIGPGGAGERGEWRVGRGGERKG